MPSDSGLGSSRSIEIQERDARQELQEKLATHLRLNDLTINTMTFVIGSFSPPQLSEFKPSAKVALMLLHRMANDIRTAGLLSCFGYSLQAAALIADCHESAFTILSVGSDDALGQKWFDHNDPKCTPFGKVIQVIQRGLENLNVQDANGEAKEEYRTYRQLCQAKHSNPLLQKFHGIRVQGDQIVLFNGPDKSEDTIILASWTLEHAAHLASLALRGFINNHLTHLSATRLAEINQRIEMLRGEKAKITEAQIAKHGNTDPFPGKW